MPLKISSKSAKKAEKAKAARTSGCAGPRRGLRPAYYRHLDPLPSQLKEEGDDGTKDCHSSLKNGKF